uniref:ER membrane protein complex subunit 4 n=1 Tax=Cacopsylla melanoneura TaxID=428564 RepID=A0A8D8TB09_9HEMI
MTANKQSNTKRMKWAVDFTNRNRTDLPTPPGYCPSNVSIQSDVSNQTDSNLLIKKCWEVALAPIKQVPMNIVIMYMAGNSISIFPIMMVGMLIVRPFKALFTLSSSFKMIEGHNVLGQKCIYVVGNIVNIILALYKCQSMGLLPSHSSDWLSFVLPQTRIEYSAGGVLFS